MVLLLLRPFLPTLLDCFYFLRKPLLFVVKLYLTSLVRKNMEFITFGSILQSLCVLIPIVNTPLSPPDQLSQNELY